MTPNPAITDNERRLFLSRLLTSDLFVTDWEADFLSGFDSAGRSSKWFTNGRRVSTDKMWMKYAADLKLPFPGTIIVKQTEPVADAGCCEYWVREPGQPQRPCNNPARWRRESGMLYCQAHAEQSQDDARRRGKVFTLKRVQ
jgi:hypothetical protein